MTLEQPPDWTKAPVTAIHKKDSKSVNGTHSCPRPVPSRAPQGSVLGPVLFLPSINDMTYQIQSTMRLFADDSIVYKKD